MEKKEVQVFSKEEFANSVKHLLSVADVAKVEKSVHVQNESTASNLIKSYYAVYQAYEELLEENKTDEENKKED